MRKLIDEVGSFLGDGINRVMLTLIVLICGVIASHIYWVNEFNSSMIDINKSIKEVEKKVDFRYFNLTRSMEDIHNVKIETHYGRIEK